MHLTNDLTESKRLYQVRFCLLVPLTNVSVFEIVLLLLTVITAETPAILYVIHQMWDLFHCSDRISLISCVYYKISCVDQHCVPVVYLSILKEIKK